MRAHFRLLRVILDHAVLGLARLVVGQHDLHRVEHGHRARRGFVQVVADAVFQQAHIHDGIRLGNAHAVDEIAHGGGGVAAAAHARQRRHARVVPAGDIAFFHQTAEEALAHHRVGQVQTRKLNLARLILEVADVDHPVVQRAVDFIFQRAERVGHPFQRVADRVREVIHRIDAPLVARAMVRAILDAVDGGVAQIDVRGSHVDLRAQHVRAFRELAVLHA